MPVKLIKNSLIKQRDKLIQKRQKLINMTFVFHNAFFVTMCLYVFEQNRKPKINEILDVF